MCVEKRAVPNHGILSTLGQPCQENSEGSHAHTTCRHQIHVGSCSCVHLLQHQFGTVSFKGPAFLVMHTLILSIKPPLLYLYKSALRAVRTCVRKTGTVCLLIPVKRHPTLRESRYTQGTGPASLLLVGKSAASAWLQKMC